MREKIQKGLRKCYGVLMNLAFWGGILPLLPFLIALIIGGKRGEAIALFLYQQYYPWVIAFASVAVLIGLTSMYLEKRKGDLWRKKRN